MAEPSTAIGARAVRVGLAVVFAVLAGGALHVTGLEPCGCGLAVLLAVLLGVASAAGWVDVALALGRIAHISWEAGIGGV
jgi:ABC-type cobalamin transport system ATPase subunit